MRARARACWRVGPANGTGGGDRRRRAASRASAGAARTTPARSTRDAIAAAAAAAPASRPRAAGAVSYASTPDEVLERRAHRGAAVAALAVGAGRPAGAGAPARPRFAIHALLRDPALPLAAAAAQPRPPPGALAESPPLSAEETAELQGLEVRAWRRARLGVARSRAARSRAARARAARSRVCPSAGGRGRDDALGGGEHCACVRVCARARRGAHALTPGPARPRSRVAGSASCAATAAAAATTASVA